jgi:hypothetical protein
MSSYFAQLEKMGDDLEVSIIRATNINKFLDHFVKLDSIPRDEEFQFRRRAINLLSKWKDVVDADSAESKTYEDEEAAPVSATESTKPSEVQQASPDAQSAIKPSTSPPVDEAIEAMAAAADGKRASEGSVLEHEQ